MESALKEVSEGALTIKHAALQHDVPKSTLHDRIVGKVIPGAKVGAPRFLDDKEELELVEFLLGATSMGTQPANRVWRQCLLARVGGKSLGIATRNFHSEVQNLLLSIMQFQ